MSLESWQHSEKLEAKPHAAPGLCLPLSTCPSNDAVTERRHDSCKELNVYRSTPTSSASDINSLAFEQRWTTWKNGFQTLCGKGCWKDDCILDWQAQFLDPSRTWWQLPHYFKGPPRIPLPIKNVPGHPDAEGIAFDFLGERSRMLSKM